MKIKLLERGLPVAPIHWALLQNPQLWDVHPSRTEDPQSPHHGLSDIWARFGVDEAAETGKPHDAVWYPCADTLGVKAMALDVMHFARGTALGGVLITRIPAGKRCRPHIDPGWHARYYDKFAVQITSAPGQFFRFEGEELESKPGDLFWFDNQHTHWVDNPTPYERITLICCIRKEN